MFNLVNKVTLVGFEPTTKRPLQASCDCPKCNAPPQGHKRLSIPSCQIFDCSKSTFQDSVNRLQKQKIPLKKLKKIKLIRIDYEIRYWDGISTLTMTIAREKGGG